MVTDPAALVLGQRVTLAFVAGRPVDGTVSWISGGRVGVEFLRD